MASITITKRAVDAAGPGRHYDTKLPGFGLYVGVNGTRSYEGASIRLPAERSKSKEGRAAPLSPKPSNCSPAFRA